MQWLQYMFTDNYNWSFCFWVFEKMLTKENCFLFCKKYGLFNGFIFLTIKKRSLSYVPNFHLSAPRGAKILVFHTWSRVVLVVERVGSRRISCHGRNHSKASCEYSLTIFLCCQHHSEYSLLGSKFSTNLLFAASKCHVTMQQRGSSRCSKWPNRMGSLQWRNIAGSLYKEEEAAEKDH